MYFVYAYKVLGMFIEEIFICYQKLDMYFFVFDTLRHLNIS